MAVSYGGTGVTLKKEQNGFKEIIELGYCLKNLIFINLKNIKVRVSTKLKNHLYKTPYQKKLFNKNRADNEKNL